MISIDMIILKILIDVVLITILAFTINSNAKTREKIDNYKQDEKIRILIEKIKERAKERGEDI